MHTKRLYPLSHDPITFSFAQSIKDFVVEELPSQTFSDNGDTLILKIKKKNLSTWDLLRILSTKLRLPTDKMGHAGLKDKHATTTQYISIPYKYKDELEGFSSEGIKIMAMFRHNRSLKTGELKGNRFFVRLKHVAPHAAGRLEKNFRLIEKNGMPNYFGYQRFGKGKDNFDQAKEVAYGEAHIQDKKVRSLLISAYQSHFFNAWLAQRVTLMKEQKTPLLPLLQGEVMMPYSDGDTFSPKINRKVEEDYKAKKIVPTGLLPGRKVWRSREEAGELEAQFDDGFIHEKGHRRAAWVFPSDMSYKYIFDKEYVELEFTLPKSAYATVVIENLGNFNLHHDIKEAKKVRGLKTPKPQVDAEDEYYDEDDY